MAVFNVVVPQAPTAIAQVILSSTNGTGITASGSAGPFPVDFFSSAAITIAVTSCSGTIAFYLQKLMPDGVNYDDISCITSLTNSTETKTLSFVNGGNTLNLRSNLGLAANTVLTVNFGAYWRVAWVSGAASVNSFAIWGDFFQ